MSWASKLSKPYRIESGKGFHMKDFNPESTGHFRSKEHAQQMLNRGIEEMAELQDKLYAQDVWALLLIFQAMDAAGKDGAIKHVMSGVNPQGCQVYSFKVPSSEELNHDFLWRYQCALPGRGTIGIFNRSHYEEVLVVRVHPDLLTAERLPEAARKRDVWERRYREINDWERYLVGNGIHVVKIMLNLSKQEQAKRFLKRIDQPAKNWKFSASDVRERRHWADYQRAFDSMLSQTSTSWAPWYVVPADHKWFSRLATAAVLVMAFRAIKPRYPSASAAERDLMTQARAELLAELGLTRAA